MDGGKLQLNAALEVFQEKRIIPPLILSIVKGSNRIRATETILSENGILEMSKESPGFNFLQQVRDESHRFAIKGNRNKKNKTVKFSKLDSIDGLGPLKKRAILNYFKSLKAIKAASLNELCMVNGISIKLANKIKKAL
ncbi:helix-hairpin-helix domain-containing protein [Gammaproteobacteria bacterium]|nr:helix-hairpin-helix domain-containing protein [Gammaproteobacteria bacterium]